MLRKCWILILADLFAFYLSLFLAYWTREFLGHYFLPQYQLDIRQWILHWWLPVLYVFFPALEGLYTFRFPFWEETKRIIKAITLAAIVVLSVVSLGKLYDKVSRVTLIFLWLYSLFLFPLIRYWFKLFLSKFSWWKEPVTVIGDEEFLDKVKQLLKNNRFLGFYIHRFIPYEEFYSPETLKDFSISGSNIMFVSIPLNRGNMETFLAKINKLGKHIVLVPEIEGLSFLNSEVYFFPFNYMFSVLVKNNLRSKANRVLKRVFDVSLALILLPFLLPIFAIIAAAIKLESKGPIFFSHERIGERGRPIKVLKFRTMYEDAEERLQRLLNENEDLKKEWEKNFKLKRDPRVTTVGRFLRKTSLDELPQIFNVLKGEMSFVGPRPVVKEEIEKYYGEFAEYYYMVKPGITGLWQVSGRSDTDYGKRVKLDTWYVVNWSLWLDFVILVKTVEAVLKGKGAY